jgi:hypothetical protein
MRLSRRCLGVAAVLMLASCSSSAPTTETARAELARASSAKMDAALDAAGGSAGDDRAALISRPDERSLLLAVQYGSCGTYEMLDGEWPARIEYGDVISVTLDPPDARPANICAPILYVTARRVALSQDVGDRTVEVTVVPEETRST